jgi:serine/threonine protein phosphatase PrpC
VNFELASDTRIGARRINQDRLGYWQTGEALFLALADGMGGHVRGEVAAQLSMEVLADEFRRAARPRIAEPGTFLGTAMHAAHAAILVEGQRMRLPESPRTVIVACLVQDGVAWWTHVGDCRLYLIRDSRIVHRTRDHSVVQRLVDQGRIREEAIESHPERNRLLQCLGGVLSPKPEPAQHETLRRATCWCSARTDSGGRSRRARCCTRSPRVRSPRRSTSSRGWPSVGPASDAIMSACSPFAIPLREGHGAAA